MIITKNIVSSIFATLTFNFFIKIQLIKSLEIYVSNYNVCPYTICDGTYNFPFEGLAKAFF